MVEKMEVNNQKEMDDLGFGTNCEQRSRYKLAGFIISGHHEDDSREV